MARPVRDDQVPAGARAEYERWRDRWLNAPAPVEPPTNLRVRDMPQALQDRLITDLLIAKAIRNGPEHWSRQILDLGDE